MAILSPEEVSEYLLSTRLEDIENLTPTTTFKISLKDDEFLNRIMEETRTDFRKVIRKGLIKAYVKCKFKKDQLTEISKAVREYQKISLFIDVPQTVKIDEINAEEHERKIITFPCEIQTISEPKTIPLTEIFVCKVCNREMSYEYNPKRKTNPECPNCKRTTKEDGIGDSETVVTVYLKEIVVDKNKRRPIRYMADIHREQAKTVDYNQKVMVTGIFKSIPPNTVRNKSKVKSEILIDVVTLESMEVDKTKKLDAQSLERFKQPAREGNLINLLVESFAPHIKFGDEAKLACILNLVGGVRQDDYKDRIHIFLCGDPSTSKTEIANYIERVAPNSTIVDGTSSTGVGLGAGAIKLPDGTMSISLGPLVKNDYVVINELDKMKGENYNKLLETFENGRCRKDIAGINEEFKTNVSIIATANPMGSVWNRKNQNVADNINIERQMLSRFDLWIRFLNIPNKKRDRAITEHIRKWRAGKIKPPFSPEELTQYLNTVRDSVPYMSEETETYLSDFYCERENYQTDEDSIIMDQRQYGALVRIAYVFAKLLFKSEVDKECIDLALDLYKRCVESFGVSFEKGGGFSEASNNLVKYTEKEEQTFRRLFRELKAKNGKVYREDIVKAMVSEKVHWKDEDVANDYIERIHNRNIIIEKDNGRIFMV